MQMLQTLQKNLKVQWTRKPKGLVIPCLEGVTSFNDLWPAPKAMGLFLSTLKIYLLNMKSHFYFKILWLQSFQPLNYVDLKWHLTNTSGDNRISKAGSNKAKEHVGKVKILWVVVAVGVQRPWKTPSDFNRAKPWWGSRGRSLWKLIDFSMS